MRKGLTDGAGYPVFEPGKKAKRSVLGRRLRNSRIPLGVKFSAPANRVELNTVRQWIVDGAKNDEHFEKNVLPLFSTNEAFVPGTPACTACHMSNQEPP